MGRVVFIGAGPGAADLITLRGARRLAEADVVLFDTLTDPALRDMAPSAHWIHVGKRGFRDSTGQATINALLVRHAREAAIVVRLKGGDPSVSAAWKRSLKHWLGPASNAKWYPASRRPLPQQPIRNARSPVARPAAA